VIDRTAVERLARVHAEPAVSILFTTDHHLPGDEAGPRRLRAMLDEARRRVAAEWDDDRAAKVLDHLERAGAAIDWRHPLDAVAIFATADDEYTFQLPVPVRDRVVIEATFATRELLLATQREVRYRVLVLSGEQARLFEGTGARVREVVDGRFPFSVEAPVHTTPSHRDLPRHDAAAGAHRFVYRSVDRVLNECSAREPLPIVVVAPERDLAYFDDVTAHARLIVARVAGDHARDGAARIATLVEPYVREAFAARDAATIGVIEEAASRHALALGVPAVWAAAMEGRGRLLVVETGFSCPARLVDGVPIPVAEGDGSLELDDAVDEIIEAVLVRRGEAVLVEPGELGQYAPIALALRH
jgi:hypothetical protein